MAANTFGKAYRLTTFGESHGVAVGGIIDGFPPGVNIDIDFIQAELNRRRSGQSGFTSQRAEPDKIMILSGVFDNVSTGTPIAFFVENEDCRPEDYDHLRNAFRPSHADFTYQKKYGIRDHRGGGRASARETLSRVVGGAFAKIILNKKGISVVAYVKQIGSIKLTKDYDKPDLNAIEKSFVRCPDENISVRMEQQIDELKRTGDTAGGIIRCVASGVPVGLGEPVFDKLQADLAKAMLSINAAKGFEYGSGFKSAEMNGSLHNDEFVKVNENINEEEKSRIRTRTNHSGGIQGGISNGEDIYFNVAFKPVPSLMKPQNSVDENGNPIIIKPRGRHDVCIVPRAVPVVEAMTAMVILDHLLRDKIIRNT
jgi:chorismate synthase